jgi:hypothetical protein
VLFPPPYRRLFLPRVDPFPFAASDPCLRRYTLLLGIVFVVQLAFTHGIFIDPPLPTRQVGNHRFFWKGAVDVVVGGSGDDLFHRGMMVRTIVFVVVVILRHARRNIRRRPTTMAGRDR